MSAPGRSVSDPADIGQKLAHFFAPCAPPLMAYRDAHDTDADCPIIVHGDLLTANDGHPDRYLVRYPSGIMSTLAAEHVRFEGDAGPEATLATPWEPPTPPAHRLTRPPTADEAAEYADLKAMGDATTRRTMQDVRGLS